MTECSHADNVWRIAESIKICMLTTVASGRRRSRPMHAVPDKDQGCLWFITDQRGAKDEEIQAAPEVCLAFAGEPMAKPYSHEDRLHAISCGTTDSRPTEPNGAG